MKSQLKLVPAGSITKSRPSRRVPPVSPHRHRALATSARSIASAITRFLITAPEGSFAQFTTTPHKSGAIPDLQDPRQPRAKANPRNQRLQLDSPDLPDAELLLLLDESALPSLVSASEPVVPTGEVVTRAVANAEDRKSVV